MPRITVLVLCNLAVAGSLMAAPAPFPKLSKVWTIGWDKPVGDGRFDRRGDKLTITVPGKNAPRLLRDVEGDFVVQVRVSGDFRSGLRGAGLLLTCSPRWTGRLWRDRYSSAWSGEGVRFSWSEDGKRWRRIEAMSFQGNLPRKVKVGVFAEGSFRPVFDKFLLTKPAK